MGKRIVSQARGHGSLTYRVRRKGYSHRVKYPSIEIQGKGKIIKIISSPGHSAPLIKIKLKKEIESEKNKDTIFYNIAANELFEGQEIEIGGKKSENGDIMRLQDILAGTKIYNIETRPGDGGKLVRSSGSFAEVLDKEKNKVEVLMPSKKTIKFDGNCRATIGRIPAEDRLDKPILKAGKRHHMMKSKGKKWHFTSKVKVNAIDHPFGGGRGKRIKSKIAKRNAPPGRKVGHLLPRKTGKKK